MLEQSIYIHEKPMAVSETAYWISKMAYSDVYDFETTSTPHFQFIQEPKHYA